MTSAHRYLPREDMYRPGPFSPFEDLEVAARKDLTFQRMVLAQGGLPRAAVTPMGTVWLNLHDNFWREGRPIQA